jgi:hypothetical protein
MMEIPKFVMPEVVDSVWLNTWREGIQERTDNAPKEVTEFIEAMADKLGDFARIGEYQEVFSGDDLKLSGQHVWGGITIYSAFKYKVAVPIMVAVDHRKSMHRIFRRRGKQGLIDYCRARVRGTHLARTLYIIDVEVFKQQTPEYISMMEKIMASKKIEINV